MNNEEAAESLEQMAEIADYDLVAEEVEACRMGAAALRTPPATGAGEMREAAAKVAEDVYGDAVAAYGPDEPRAVGAKIAAAIRALPAPEVPE